MTTRDPHRTPYRVGIVGTNWGLIHILGFTQIGIPIHGLCGRDPQKTRTIAEREGIPFHTSDVDELARECDIVVVASSDNRHFEHIATALKHGCHVLTEKPITTRYEDAADLISLSRDVFVNSGLITAISYPYRSVPSMRQIQQWIAAHDPEHLVVQFSNSFGDAEGRALEGDIHGLSGDFAGVSHALDAALWFLNREPEYVQAHLVGRPPYTSHLHVELGGQRTIDIHQVTSRKPGIDGAWRIYGRDWELQFTGQYIPAENGWFFSPVKYFDSRESKVLAEAISPHNSEREPWAQSFVHTAEAFVESIEKKALQYPLASFADGARVQKVFAAAIASELTKSRIAFDAVPLM